MCLHGCIDGVHTCCTVIDSQFGKKITAASVMLDRFDHKVQICCASNVAKQNFTAC